MAETNVPVATRPDGTVDKSPIGANVKRLRGPLSQEELALRAGGEWSQGLVSQIETGRWRNPSYEKLRQLATALGVTVADLYAE